MKANALNVKVMKFKQARVNGRSNYDWHEFDLSGTSWGMQPKWCKGIDWHKGKKW